MSAQLKFSDYQQANTDVKLTVEEQQAFLDIQHSILKMVVSNQPQAEILAELCNMAEALVPQSIASVMLIQSNQRMDVISAPTVPPEGQLLLNGLKPGPNAGTCGNAVYRNEAVFASNVHNDSRCTEICNIFDQFELNSCWSNPVRNAKGESIGSFALSSVESRSPSIFHKELLAISSYIIGIILERSKQQEQLEKMAYEDALTGLANRSGLYKDLSAFIEKSKKHGNSFGLVYVDLKRFKVLNDNFGHSFGDEILKVIGKRLLENTPDAHCLARVGGDEFVVVGNSIDAANALANKIVNALTQHITYKNYRFLLDCCVGIACYPKDGKDAETLLKNADTAMYRAKRDDLRICYYQSAFSSKAKEEFILENKLGTAIQNDELSLYFQAKVDAHSHQETGYEVLLRWHDADNKFISPAEFIPVAENTGLIIPIGEWVVKTALKHAEELMQLGSKPFNLAINISGAQLLETHINALLAHVNKSSFPNERIFFEVTETVLVKEASYASDLLEKIRQSGVKLSIDDFGMGYSSLGYLKRFKVSQLKMDKVLIDDIDTNEESLAIARAVIALGHSLGLEVVAEGVENKQQAVLLDELNCDTIQGFYFSRPTAFEEVKKRLG